MQMADLFRERCYCELGRVQTPPAPPPTGPTAARMVQVRLVPSGRVVDARVLNLGQGVGKGAFMPLQVGDEVLVLFPGGDPLRAVCIGGLGSAVAPNPVGNTGLRTLIQHPGGVLLATTDGQPAHGIVHGQFLADLSTFLTALDDYLTAVAAALTAATSPVDPVSQTAWEAASAAFGTAVAASATSGTPPGVGGPPHATLAHKVTP